MELVLNAGANPDLQDIRGQTALHWAANEGSIDAVELLINRGADTTVYNKDGYLYSNLVLHNPSMN